MDEWDSNPGVHRFPGLGMILYITLLLYKKGTEIRKRKVQWLIFFEVALKCQDTWKINYNILFWRQMFPAVLQFEVLQKLSCGTCFFCHPFCMDEWDFNHHFLLYILDIILDNSVTLLSKERDFDWEKKRKLVDIFKVFTVS